MMYVELNVDGQTFAGDYLNMVLHTDPASELLDTVRSFNLVVESFPKELHEKICYLKIDNGKAFCGNVRVISESLEGVLDAVTAEVAGKPDIADMSRLQRGCADSEFERSCSVFELE